MPPRQPLRPKRPVPKKPKLPAERDAVAALAEQLLKEAPPKATPAPQPHGAPPRPEAPKDAQRSFSFSPYPDLTMAIAMLKKRAQHLGPDGERAKLVGRWAHDLEELQAAMQKLHKLENLAARVRQGV